MQITLKLDRATQHLEIKEEDCTDEFVFSSIAEYLGKRCCESFPNAEEALHMLAEIQKYSANIVKEKFLGKSGQKK
jgi:hypothetical protein